MAINIFLDWGLEDEQSARDLASHAIFCWHFEEDCGLEFDFGDRNEIDKALRRANKFFHIGVHTYNSLDSEYSTSEDSFPRSIFNEYMCDNAYTLRSEIVDDIRNRNKTIFRKQ